MGNTNAAEIPYVFHTWESQASITSTSSIKVEVPYNQVRSRYRERFMRNGSKWCSRHLVYPRDCCEKYFCWCCSSECQCVDDEIIATTLSVVLPYEVKAYYEKGYLYRVTATLEAYHSDNTWQVRVKPGVPVTYVCPALVNAPAEFRAAVESKEVTIHIPADLSHHVVAQYLR